MKQRWLFVLILISIFISGSASSIGCDDDDDDDDSGNDDDDDDSGDDDDDTGDDDIDRPHLLPGPNEPGYDPELEAKANRYDRMHLVFNLAGQGINASGLTVPVENTEDRELIEKFLQETDSWDFKVYSSKDVFDVVTNYDKVAGLYGGVGIAAEAYRYGLFRDQGYPEEDVERAREYLMLGIEGLFVAVEITGETGVIARGFSRTDIPTWYADHETTPLFDGSGNPLPPVKDNGTWREDNSPDGRFPNYKWEDSCSRDMFIGWATAFAAIWEVIKDDPTFDREIKDKLQRYAKEIGYSLMVERTGGPGAFGGAFDLEIFDADGRTTFHGYLNENAFDRVYLAWLPFKDGFYAVMSLGIVGALSYCAEDETLDRYLYEELIGERGLDKIAEEQVLGFNFGLKSNFSGTNMALQGAILAQRYINDEAVRARVGYATAYHMYLNGDTLFTRKQPEEYAYSMYDFAYAAAISRASAFGPMTEDPDVSAVERGVQTLMDFGEPPHWNYKVENCDEQEIESGRCVLSNGMPVTVLGYVGRNGSLVTEEPIPQAVRPPSNYRWRSNPYEPNGDGDGSAMMPGVDFRWAYWYGRWVY